MAQSGVWYRWAVKLGKDFGPGVFAIAISDRNLSGKRYTCAEEIVLFWLTEKDDGKRFVAFEDSLRQRNGKRGAHGPANQMHEEYPNWKRLQPRLYVAYLNSPGGTIPQLKNECVAQYRDEHRRRPKYN